jgi:hypothetical protein
MRTLLHILTRSNDVLAAEITARQCAQPEHQVEVVDLTASEPDYRLLLGKVFEADSVQVW